jgi:hypothetical protein
MCTAFDYWPRSADGAELVLVYTLAAGVVVARLLPRLGWALPLRGRWVRYSVLALFVAVGLWVTGAYLLAPAKPPLPAVVPASSLSPWARTPIEHHILVF